MSTSSRFLALGVWSKNRDHTCSPQKPSASQELFLDNSHLLRLYQQGERKTLQKIFMHYSPLLALAFARGVICFSQGQRSRLYPEKVGVSVEDLLQETFTRAFSVQARQSYTGQGSYKNYLFSIARNYLLYLLRKQSYGADTIDLTEEVNVMSDEDKLFQTEIIQAIRSYKARLSALDQRILKCRYEERQPRHEVQKHLKLSLMQLRYKEYILLSGLKKHLYALDLVNK